MVRLTIILCLPLTGVYTGLIIYLRIPLRKPQSAIPAFVMGTLCIVGGVTGYARTRSIPSIVAGIGSVLLWYLR